MAEIYFSTSHGNTLEPYVTFCATFRLIAIVIFLYIVLLNQILFMAPHKQYVLNQGWIQDYPKGDGYVYSCQRHKLLFARFDYF